ncbi:phosphoglycerate dehydrogenase [Elusimicrobiota bacterium]
MSSETKIKVLITDSFSSEGIALLKKEGYKVDLDPSLDGNELKKEIAGYHALIIRSGTTVTSDIIERANSLRIIGRAGVGVDNIDVEAATRKGIIVMNTPGGDTISACEHTWALILSLVRNIPRAHQSLKEGKWDKKSNKGTELYGKTLGIIGLGKIGSEVARRAKGFGMKIKVFDPYVSETLIEELEAVATEFDEIIETSDIITVHVPKNEKTINMLNAIVLNKMKKSAYLINCARGGIVNEEDLADAVGREIIKGAAVDVYSIEPTTESPVFNSDGIIHTPHLGASTEEAQERVAVEIVRQVAAYFKNSSIVNAVNIYGPKADAPLFELAYKLGSVCGQLSKKLCKKIILSTDERIKKEHENSLVRALLNGYLSCFNDGINFVNALLIAKEKNIEVVKQQTNTEGFHELLSVNIDNKVSVKGGIPGEVSRIYEINNFEIDIPLKGKILMIRNNDVPGVIGFVGTLLGEYGINIGFMEVGRKTEGGTALTLIGIDQSVSSELLKKLSNEKRIESVGALSV